MQNHYKKECPDLQKVPLSDRPSPCRGVGEADLRGLGLSLLKGLDQLRIVQHVASGGGQLPQQSVLQLLQETLVVTDGRVEGQILLSMCEDFLIFKVLISCTQLH